MTENQPQPNQLTLDHSGHFVSDAVAATDALTELGFTVTPYSAQIVPSADEREPQLTGTGNVCVMLQHGYLEFLVHTADTPLGLEFKQALDRRAGLHLAAFSVENAEQYHTDRVRKGHAMRPLVKFSREVSTATGFSTARFTVARLQPDVMPEGRVQVMTHHDIDAMWQPRWTKHRNGANALLGIVISTPDVNDTLSRYKHFLGVDPVENATGWSFHLARGSIDVLPEDLASSMFGQMVEPGRSVFVGLRVGIADISVLHQLGAFDTAVIATGEIGNSNPISVIPFGDRLGKGVWLFEPRASGHE